MGTITSKITTVNELVENLKNIPAKGSYLNVMKSIDIPQQEFERFYIFKNEHYTRVSLVKTDDFELLLICWEKGQKSPIHDFDSQEAWIHTIKGQLTEERYRLIENKLEKVSSVLLGTSEFSYMTNVITIHRYSNSYESRTVSLNLYAKPIKKWKEYNIETGKTTHKKVSYDAVYQFDEKGDSRTY
jgi:cysteine dioxygenase